MVHFENFNNFIFVIYIKLPADEPRKSEWIQFFEDSVADTTKIKPLTSIICSEYFNSDCFKNYVRSKLLKKDAVPSFVVKRLKYVSELNAIYQNYARQNHIHALSTY